MLFVGARVGPVLSTEQGEPDEPGLGAGVEFGARGGTGTRAVPRPDVRQGKDVNAPCAGASLCPKAPGDGHAKPLQHRGGASLRPTVEIRRPKRLEPGGP